MKIFYTSVIIFLLLIPPSLSQQYERGDKLYIWDIYGTELISSLNNPKIDTQYLAHGESIEFIALAKSSNLTKTYQGVLNYEGSYLKVKSSKGVGFIFSGAISSVDINPIIVNRYDYFPEHILGSKLEEHENDKTIQVDNEQMVMKETVTVYENGNHVFTPFDGCYLNSYQFKTLSLIETYHLMMNLYSWDIDNYSVTPKFTGTIENGFTFTEGTIAIELIELDGIYEIHTSDCEQAKKR